MGPGYTASQRTAAEEADERQLQAARDSLPGWQILETFGGYLAVPAGTVVTQSTTLDGLVAKLRQQGGEVR